MRGLLRASISAVALRGGSTFAADLGPRNSLYVTPIAPIVASNWRATPGQQWTVPVGGGFGRVFKIGDQPVNASIAGYYNAVRPTATPVWQLRASVVLCACISTAASADEGGVSFWLPGLFGSLAATPLQPGLTFSSTYYHTSVTGEGDVSRAREITVGRFPINFSGSANLQLEFGSKPRHIQRDLHAAYPGVGWSGSRRL